MTKRVNPIAAAITDHALAFAHALIVEPIALREARTGRKVSPMRRRAITVMLSHRPMVRLEARRRERAMAMLSPLGARLW